MAAVPSFQPDIRSQQLNSFAKFIGDDRADKVRWSCVRVCLKGEGSAAERATQYQPSPSPPPSPLYGHPLALPDPQVRRRYGRPLKAVVITAAGVVGEQKASPAAAGGARAAAIAAAAAGEES